MQSMYNHSEITYPRANTIVRESCLKKLVLELDLLMGSWNKKLYLGPSPVFSSLLQHYCYRFYIFLNNSLLHIFRWPYKSTNQSLTYMLKVCLDKYALSSNKSLLCHIICVLLEICSGPLKFWGVKSLVL